MVPAKTPSYQQLRSDLDLILEQLQRDDLDVDAATAAFERGMKLVTQLEAYLKSAENKITKIKASFDSGQGKA